MTRSGAIDATVTLQEATLGDLELLLAWRSIPAVHEHFTQQSAPPTWEEHVRWWSQRTERKDWIILLHDGDEVRRVGAANASRLGQSMPEVGLYIGELSLWGKHVGEYALREVLSWLGQRAYGSCWAGIREDNDRSRRLFERVGFRYAGYDSPGRLRYELELSASAVGRPHSTT